MSGPPIRRRVVAIVQARTNSVRLPRKVVASVGPYTLLERLLRQLEGCRLLDQIMVATSIDPSDDALAQFLEANGRSVYRGELEDVLDRFRAAAEQSRADVIVRLTGDCPLHTPDTIDEVVSAFLASRSDYASNIDPYTRPDGLDVEVFTREALEYAAARAPNGPDREHVTLYLRRAKDIKRLSYVHSTGPVGRGLRWTVDDFDDLEFVRRVWNLLDRSGPGPHNYETVMNAALAVHPNEQASVSNKGLYSSLYDAALGEKAAALPLQESERWLARSAKVIPGGAQTYSKSWRQHIRGVSPIFLEHGEGPYVWDVDGTRYVDLIQGLLPNILGYAREEVDRAAFERARRGHSFSLPNPIEVELAERLTRIIPCAEMVRFGKNGSDATAGAVRVARAFTRRERVAVCGYHGWQDWYIGTTTRCAGVPQSVRALAVSFPYGDVDALDRILATHPGEYAAVVMEPVTFTWPAIGYLEGVKEVAHKHGALLIFDEICTGFHFGLGGAQKLFGVLPDLATFGKALGNGYAISCIVGRRDVMALFDEVFVSFTFAGDASAMAAAIAVLDILEHSDAYVRMEEAGKRLVDGAREFAASAGLGSRFETHGHPNWTMVRFLDEQRVEDSVTKTLWQQEMVRRGVLVLATHNISAAMDYAATEHVLKAYAETFKYIGRLISKGESLAEHLDGPIPTPAFRARG